MISMKPVRVLAPNYGGACCVATFVTKKGKEKTDSLTWLEDSYYYENPDQTEIQDCSRFGIGDVADGGDGESIWLNADGIEVAPLEYNAHLERIAGGAA